jgi:hypothetical protein
MKNYIIIPVCLFLILSGCGKGIEPEPEKKEEGFGGQITFTGTWPDSITRTHIVVFKNPLISASDFNALNLAYVSLEIPYGTTIFNYSTLDSALFPVNTKLATGVYSYVAVAQQKTINITLNREDWFVAGIYYVPADTLTPGIVTVRSGEFSENINIICDFNNPPPQPPGGK